MQAVRQFLNNKMGKTQSKRSVDITTDPKKGEGEETVTEKLEKIEDVDQQKQLNGDATPQENNEGEKKDLDESENHKDEATEKSSAEAETTQTKSDDAKLDQNVTNTATPTIGDETPKDDAAAATNKEENEKISPLADESLTNKPKKEKGKKKWSFRSISFGKKDKQKPSKTEEPAENAAATNGEAEKVVTEGVIAEAVKKDEDASGDAKPATENGEATEKELNGQKTPTPVEEKSNEIAAGNDNNTTTNSNTTANDAAAVVSAATTNTSNNDATAQKQTEITAKIAINTDVITGAATAIFSNGDAEKNSTINVDIVADKIAELAIDIKTIPSSAINNGNDIPHQNGTNGAENEHHDEQNGSGGDQQLNEKTKIEDTINVQLSKNKVEAQENLDQQQQQQQPTEIEHKQEELQQQQPTEIEHKQEELQQQPTEIELKQEELQQQPTEIELKQQDQQQQQQYKQKHQEIQQLQQEVPEAIEQQGAKQRQINQEQEQQNDKQEDTSIISAQPSVKEEHLKNAACDNQESNAVPPPLPNNPPPSQVTMFAFNDNVRNEVEDEVEVAHSSKNLQVQQNDDDNAEIETIDVLLNPISANEILEKISNSRPLTEDEVLQEYIENFLEESDVDDANVNDNINAEELIDRFNKIQLAKITANPQNDENKDNQNNEKYEVSSDKMVEMTNDTQILILDKTKENLNSDENVVESHLIPQLVDTVSVSLENVKETVKKQVALEQQQNQKEQLVEDDIEKTTTDEQPEALNELTEKAVQIPEEHIQETETVGEIPKSQQQLQENKDNVVEIGDCSVINIEYETKNNENALVKNEELIANENYVTTTKITKTYAEVTATPTPTPKTLITTVDNDNDTNDTQQLPIKTETPQFVDAVQTIDDDIDIEVKPQTNVNENISADCTAAQATAITVEETSHDNDDSPNDGIDIYEKSVLNLSRQIDNLTLDSINSVDDEVAHKLISTPTTTDMIEKNNVNDDVVVVGGGPVEKDF